MIWIAVRRPPAHRVALLVLLANLAGVEHAAAQPAIFVVRHAERADSGTAGAAMMDKDPDLSTKGRDRAQSLAGMLRDAEIRAIYTTELKRAQQTAAPLATAVGARMMTMAAADVIALAEKVRAETGNVLIVGHSNTIPKILAALGVAGSIEIGDNEYDNLFIVVGDKPARVLRLRYE